MGYDGKALAGARAAIALKKRNNEAEHLRRTEQVRQAQPAVGELDRELTRLMSSVALDALKKGGDPVQAIRDAEARCAEIRRDKGRLLSELGLPEDYLDEIYSCPDCRDSGYVDGRPCRCLMEEYKKENIRLLSSLLDLGRQSFDSFDLSLYESGSKDMTTEAVRRTMSGLRDICRQYAENFGRDSANLLFRGSPGLGKTFLSACIARVVSESGFSVVYDTAVSVFDAFETQKFDRGGEEAVAEAASAVRRCLNCDLLILDDLGTELSAGYTQSALYTIINTRLINGGKTIISTNLSEDELRQRYSSQIVSRLLGEYMSLLFVGRDIRQVKAEQD